MPKMVAQRREVQTPVVMTEFSGDALFLRMAGAEATLQGDLAGWTLNIDASVNAAFMVIYARKEGQPTRCFVISTAAIVDAVIAALRDEKPIGMSLPEDEAVGS